MITQFSNCLHILAQRLHLAPAEEKDIILELESHLEDRASDLEAEGLDRATAQDLAVQQLGDPVAIASRMYTVHSPGVWLDVAMATTPHFLLAALFALNLWSNYFLVALLLIGITLVTMKNWRAGTPSKWSYSWLGYTLAAPALSWLLALIALGYGAWILVTTGGLPFNTAFFILLIGYVPFSLWILATVISRVIRQDWLLASLTALPFPFLTSWVLFLNWRGGLWSPHAEGIQETDSDRALIFLAMAVTTAVFLKVGPRLVKIGLLSLSTAILVIATVASLPISFSLVAVLLMMVASVAFLLSPAMLDSQLNEGRSRYPLNSQVFPLGRGGLSRGIKGQSGEEVTHWFANGP